MELKVEVPSNLNIDLIQLQKMTFVYNALDAGWSVKKIDNQYIFSKKHEGKREVYLDTYLQKFIESNLVLK
jgi:hypothetical protein